MKWWPIRKSSTIQCCSSIESITYPFGARYATACECKIFLWDFPSINFKSTGTFCRGQTKLKNIKSIVCVLVMLLSHGSDQLYWLKWWKCNMVNLTPFLALKSCCFWKFLLLVIQWRSSVNVVWELMYHLFVFGWDIRFIITLEWFNNKKTIRNKQVTQFCLLYNHILLMKTMWVFEIWSEPS